MLPTNESKLIISCCHCCFLWFKFSGNKHWYSFRLPAFLFQRGCDSLGASTDKTYFHADRLFNSQINGPGERHHADVWGNRLPFPLKTKNNFSGIDISQPTPSMSLSVPSFSLAFIDNNVFHSRWVNFNVLSILLKFYCLREISLISNKRSPRINAAVESQKKTNRCWSNNRVNTIMFFFTPDIFND